jgi:penicillin-binding protein 2
MQPFRPNFSGFNGDSLTVGKGWQSKVLISIITCGLLAVGVRLTYLQVLEGTNYRQRAEKNRVRIVAAKRPTRGNILDRNGKVLASNRLSYSVFVWPAAIKKPTWPDSRKRLSEVLGMGEQEIQDKVSKVKITTPELVRLARDISSDKIIALKEFSTDKDGIEVDIENIRDYPHGELASHVLGHTGELTDKELATRRADGYRLTDAVNGVVDSLK